MTDIIWVSGGQPGPGWEMQMYAVIEDRGKQYKVSQGDRIEIDLCEAAPGDVIEFDKILFCSDEGAPKVGARVFHMVAHSKSVTI